MHNKLFSTSVFFSFIFLSLISSFSGISYSQTAASYQDVGYPIVKVHGIEQHNSGSQVWWLKVDENNHIYTASSNGIASFDGEQWRQHNTPKETIVRSITFWNGGDIYAGTINDLGFFSYVKALDKKSQLTEKVQPNGEPVTFEQAYTYSPGELGFISLLPFWKGDATEIGEVFSTASTPDFVAFSSSNKLLTWDGDRLRDIQGLSSNRFRLFNVDDELLFVGRNDTQVQAIKSPDIVEAKPWKVPAGLNVMQIIKTHEDQLLLLTMSNGLFELKGNEFEQVISPADLPQGLRFYNGMQASDGYFYFTTLFNGIFILDKHLNILRNYQSDDGLGIQTVLGVAEDKQGSIWLSGEPNIVVFQAPHLRSQHRFSDTVYNSDVVRELDGALYMVGNAIYQFESGPAFNVSKPQDMPVFSLIEGVNEKFFEMELIDGVIYGGAESGIYAIEKDARGMYKTPERIVTGRNVRRVSETSVAKRFYAADDEHVFRAELIDGKWQKTIVQGVSDLFEYILVEKTPDTQSEVVWAASSDAILYRMEGITENGTVSNLQVFKAQEYGLGIDNILIQYLFGQIQFGTFNGMLLFDDSGDEPRFILNTDLPKTLRSEGVDVFKINQTDNNALVYQAGGISGYAFKQQTKWQVFEAAFTPYNKSNIRGIDKYNDAVWLSTASSDIYRVALDAVKNIPPVGKLSIRRITNINDETILTNFSPSLPLRDISQAENSIRIHFALADHTTPLAHTYRARISGQGHQNWTAWTSESHKDFPLLSGGDYTFEVEARDPWGRIQSASIAFTVLPPWYLSTGAFFVYFIVLIIALVISGYATQKWRTRVLKKQNLLLEKTVLERTCEVNAAAELLRKQQLLKDRFFGNVSHEFRTPLTLTIGPLQDFMNTHQDKLSNDAKHLIASALANAKKMLALVSQVLDIERLEAGKMQLHVSEHDIAELIRRTVNDFQSWAKENKQSLAYKNCDDPASLYIDIDQIQRSLSNLISNAIKYSGEGSDIFIELENTETLLNIHIIDNGVGVDDSERDKIFQRFFQAKNSDNSTQPGTGIGLALVKDIIGLHKGEVHLLEQTAQGCHFVLSLKKGKAHFNNDDLQEPISLTTELIQEKQLPHAFDASSANNRSTGEPAIAPTVSQTSADQTTLLVVDDNAELRHFISLRLSDTYKIIEAQNGQLGFSAACEFLPDLIISDVSMPVMSGYELTQKLKSAQATKNIPVILLTAKATKRETIEGFEAGADDYLTKPFDTSELVMRVNAQIMSRKQIRQNIQFEQSAEITGRAQTNDFSKSIITHIEKHMQDPEFSIEALAEKMHMSAATLTRKCKQYCDETPRSLLINIRIQHATNLLSKDNMPISEIAYAVGFESLSYFSRSFKKHTGFNPTEFVKRQKR